MALAFGVVLIFGTCVLFDFVVDESFHDQETGFSSHRLHCVPNPGEKLR